MSKYMYNSLKYILIILLTLMIISTIFNDYSSIEESFVPKIVKENYRPIERNIRRRIEGFYDKSSINMSNLFRKFGII